MNLPLPWMLSTVVVRTVIILFVVVIGLRIFGKRDVGDLDLIDVLVILLIGNAVQNAITYGSGNLYVGMVSAGTLIVADWLMGNLFVRHPWIQKKVIGEPTIIFSNGKLDRKAMDREGVSEEEMFSAIHQQGLSDLKDIRLAVLEPNGEISVIPKENDGEEDEGQSSE